MADEIPPALPPQGELGAYLHLGLAAFSVIGMTVFASGTVEPQSKRLVPPEAAPREVARPRPREDAVRPRTRHFLRHPAGI